MSCPECHRLAEHRRFTAFGGQHVQCLRLAARPVALRRRLRRAATSTTSPTSTGSTAGLSAGEETHDMTHRDGGHDRLAPRHRDQLQLRVQPVTMDGAFSRDALRGVFTCSGRRPWLGGENEPCDLCRVRSSAAPRTSGFPSSSPRSPSPRGPRARSGCSTATGSPCGTSRTTAFCPSWRGWAWLEAPSTAPRTSSTPSRHARATGGARRRPASLRPQEYDALVRGRAETSKEQDFVCVAPERLGRGR